VLLEDWPLTVAVSTRLRIAWIAFVTSELEKSSKAIRIAATLDAATNANTRAAYEADLRDLFAWQVAQSNTPSLAIDGAEVVEWLDHLANDRGLKIGTLKRRIAALSTAAKLAGVENATKDPIVGRYLAGLARQKGSGERSAKPLVLDELWATLAAFRAETDSAAIRDRAILLVGFHGALRRSEIAALRIEDFEPNERGGVLTIRASKGDQAGEGQQVPIYRRTLWCPVGALRDLALYLEREEGPLFCEVYRSGRFASVPLWGRSVSEVIVRRTTQAGLEGYSGHSLRAGFCVSSRLAGSSEFAVKRVTRHKHLATLHKYFSRADLFDEDPLRGLA
jgi:integrase